MTVGKLNTESGLEQFRLWLEWLNYYGYAITQIAP